MSRLHLAAADLETVERHALGVWPAECCGLLLGKPDGTGDKRVSRVVPCVNAARTRPRRRFTIDPEELLGAWRGARARGEEVLGSYHSHPASAAVPSRPDRDAAWPGSSCLILPVEEGAAGTARSWRLADGGFEEEELVVAAGRGAAPAAGGRG